MRARQRTGAHRGEERRRTVVSHALVASRLVVLQQVRAGREAQEAEAEARRKISAPGAEDVTEAQTGEVRERHALDRHNDYWAPALDALLHERARVVYPVRARSTVPTPVKQGRLWGRERRQVWRAYPWIQNITGRCESGVALAGQVMLRFKHSNSSCARDCSGALPAGRLNSSSSYALHPGCGQIGLRINARQFLRDRSAQAKGQKLTRAGSHLWPRGTWCTDETA